MALFQTSVIKTYLAQQDNSVVERAYKKYTKYFHNATIQENIKNSKEEQYQAKFLDELFVNVLGYTLNPKPDFNITTEFKNQKGAGKADGAILKEAKAIGVIELKGTNTKDLESIRKQAFDYKANQKGCVYVITSNFEKLRFYINDATEFLEFNLFQLAPEEFALMYLCLQKDNILNNLPLTIKEASLVEEDKITKQFYNDYSVFKRELFRDLVKRNAKRLKQNVIASEARQSHNEDDSNELKSLEKNVKLSLFKKSQKLIDRFLFIFFAEDRDLLPPNSTIQILDKWKADIDFGDERPLYNLFKQYFHFLDEGRKGTTSRAEIYAYNGGLFKPDAILDSLEIDDDLLYKHTYKLAKYDFSSQVDVNILGHIFENSLNEIESVNAEIEGGEFDKQKSKRKKDGVFYTPKYITKYIVENTVGKLCQEKKDQLGFKEEAYFEIKKGTHQNTKKQLLEVLDNYRAWLLKITICDPACGSGAFLNQALDFLIKEHRYIDELKAKVLGGGLILSDIENTILENNIYGVDLNEESVEIAKLSLWLRTAQPRRKLNDLSNNIKCGNSLIDSKTVAGDKAFNWQQEFPQIFDKGGFDVIIGNPPYVARSLDDGTKKFINKNFQTAQYQIDLYVSFMEKGTEILTNNGAISYIVPNSWLKNLKMSDCRKYVLNNLHFTVIIPNLDNVFPDASVDTLVYVAQKNPTANGKIDIVEVAEKQTFLKHEIKQNRFLNNEGYIFDVEISESILPIIQKVRSEVISVGEIMDVTRGVNPYDKYTGQSAEVIKNRAYHANYKKDESFVPELKGKHVSTYNYNWDKEHYISYGEWLAAPRQEKYFKGPRIVFREILGKTLVSTLIREQFIIDRSLYIARIDDETQSKFIIEYIISILNSKLMSFYFRYSNNEFDTLFPKIRVAEFKKLPIKIARLEVQHKSKILVDELLSAKSNLIATNEKFKTFFNHSFSLSKISRKLENWHELDFADFIKELNKVIKKTGGTPLTKKDEFEWLELFEENKKKAQELQTQITQTEITIDTMVYDLYGLTEEERNIVENS
ncbi:Eco57I restriction-modification methylase domain-containing protein [Winogradskyella sediminis]|uniref:site-specific DNA-methyltransferase (adenine-specific) n=1 Tax=Winogradskyella sediminis TaxID=1382466 RepID=A0A1H1VZ13_9FLAO|nr:TaqI-like C-terminal specificity domain-containing protein [Winogradskyella sediminis]SDS89992.1 N-6 DNA Methylase [Winogradskyella sediminis]